VAENRPTEMARALPTHADGAAATILDAQPAMVETMMPDEIKVRRGDTLFNILSDAGLDRLQAHNAVEALGAHYDPRKLKVGQVLSVVTTTGGDNRLLHRLELPIDDENDLALVRDAAGGFEVKTSTKQFVSERRRASGDIAISLYLAAQNAGVPQDTLMELIKLYSWDIDFQRDIHPNDRFEIYYDHMTSEDGSVVKSGGIIYAELTSGGEPLRAYRYENSDGEVGYYDAQGRSLRKWLMRTPVDGARLSSGFGKRKHPILGYTRMHKGVDFAAPRGTPIYAAGDGTIAVIGRNGGYGNYVRIRHSGTYATAYAHMNGFAKGLGKGSRVKQGQVIGYVGSTGRSTGPHLHYEILKDGAQINPLSLKKDVAERLNGAEMARFAELRDSIDRELENPGSKTIVAQRP
jgi:murein DD-endopeptidase MepM/ murein hydrolase activator NlpD